MHLPTLAWLALSGMICLSPSAVRRKYEYDAVLGKTLLEDEGETYVIFTSMSPNSIVNVDRSLSI